MLSRDLTDPPLSVILDQFAAHYFPTNSRHKENRHARKTPFRPCPNHCRAAFVVIGAATLWT